MPFVTTQDGTEIFYKDWGSGQPIMFHHEVFDDFREGTAFNRAQYYRDVAAGPFYGFNRPGRRRWRASSRTGGGKA
jgi:hypothetical protein